MLFILAGSLGALSILLGTAVEYKLRQQFVREYRRYFISALRYHQLHTLAILVIAVFMQFAYSQLMAHFMHYAVSFFIAAIILYSGMIYAYIFTGKRFFIYLTPLGGLGFLMGWGMIAYAGWIG